MTQSQLNRFRKRVLCNISCYLFIEIVLCSVQISLQLIENLLDSFCICTCTLHHSPNLSYPHLFISGTLQSDILHIYYVGWNETQKLIEIKATSQFYNSNFSIIGQTRNSLSVVLANNGSCSNKLWPVNILISMFLLSSKTTTSILVVVYTIVTLCAQLSVC